MEFFKRQTNFNFIGTRYIPITISAILITATIVSLFTRGLNFGLDFTGGTVIEVSYKQAADLGKIRDTLAGQGLKDTVVQLFGTSRDVLIRVPAHDTGKSAQLSNKVTQALREPYNEKLVSSPPGKAQECSVDNGKMIQACAVQVQRVEFVGPQVGHELAEKGALALLYTLIAVLIYVMLRFEWRFAIGAVIATAHDVLITLGFFSFTQMEFSLTVLAAVLAVLGYSLNDTIVVFDRIRENFRKMRKESTVEVMNVAINQTLSRTIITSGTTMITVLAMYFFGGQTIRGFAVALIVGIFYGTFSSIYIATPAALALGVSRADLVRPKRESAADSEP
jgi:preprotein translocase subunit SecF